MAQTIAGDLRLWSLPEEEAWAVADAQRLLELVLPQLSRAVVERLRGLEPEAAGPSSALEARLGRIEELLARVVTPDQDDDEDEAPAGGSVFPNLKYAKPKYRTVDSILKYFGGEGDEATGFKLVIMNFND